MENIKQLAKKIIPHNLWLVLIKLKQNYKDYLIRKENIKLIKNTYLHYKEVEKQLYNRADKKIRFACYVMYASDFGEGNLVNLMKNDEDFIPKIVVVPDISRGKEHMLNVYNNTKTFLIDKYDKEIILDGYNEEKDIYNDYSDNFDIIALNCPYSNMANNYHTVEYLSQKNVLTFYAGYGFPSTKYPEKAIFPTLAFSLFWRTFVDSKYTLKSCKKYSLSHGKNTIPTGYIKMDGYSKCEIKKQEKKTILLAPHHSVNLPALPLSNFMSYYNLILELPDLFPEINFIFRPHPLLFTHLINKGYWTEKQVQKYLEDIKSKGIIYSSGGDYFELFANSDAIIHDCGSYITEWLFTGKPCCFVAKDKSIFKLFTRLGHESIKHYTIAYTKDDIINFIRNINENNVFKPYINDKTLNKNVFINYPNVSKSILDYLRFN